MKISAMKCDDRSISSSTAYSHILPDPLSKIRHAHRDSGSQRALRRPLEASTALTPTHPPTRFVRFHWRRAKVDVQSTSNKSKELGNQPGRREIPVGAEPTDHVRQHLPALRVFRRSSMYDSVFRQQPFAHGAAQRRVAELQ